MEELLKATEPKKKVGPTQQPLSNAQFPKNRARPEKKSIRKQSDDDLINDLLHKSNNNQPDQRSKSKLSNMDVNDLLGLNDKTKTDNVDDLDNILSTSGAKLEPRWKLKGDSPRLNP